MRIGASIRLLLSRTIANRREQCGGVRSGHKVLGPHGIELGEGVGLGRGKEDDLGPGTLFVE
jgi:hypothetical protein